MLAKIVPRFVISGVIQNAYYANYMAMEMSKQIIGDDLELFMHYDSKKYFVAQHSLRNATSSATSPHWPDPPSSPTSSRLRNTMKQSASSQSTTMSKKSSNISTNSHSKSKNSSKL